MSYISQNTKVDILKDYDKLVRLITDLETLADKNVLTEIQITHYQNLLDKIVRKYSYDKELNGLYCTMYELQALIHKVSGQDELSLEYLNEAILCKPDNQNFISVAAQNYYTSCQQIKKSQHSFSRIKIFLICILALIVVSGIFELFHIHTVDLTKQNSALRLANSQTNQPVKQISTISSSPINSGNIVNELNQYRVARGLPALHWITELNTAAIARAKFMASNNTTSNTVGNPWADITNANYNYSTADVGSVFDNSNSKNVVKQLTTGIDSNLGNSTTYNDIGVGVVPDTINGSPTQLVVVYLATQAVPPPTTQTTTQSCQQGYTGIYPHCVSNMCLPSTFFPVYYMQCGF